MSARDPEAIQHELTYWQLALDDVRALNQLISETSDPLAIVPVHMLAIVTGAGDTGEAANAASERIIEAFGQLRAMQAKIDALLALIGGRVTAIGRELPS